MRILAGVAWWLPLSLVIEIIFPGTLTRIAIMAFEIRHAF